jgi:GYF domain 2
MIYRSDEDPNWFYVHEGRREGPFDRRELIQALLARDAPEKTLVWRSGLSHWTKAGEIQELRLELPPPIPREAQPREAAASGEPPPVRAEGEAAVGSAPRAVGSGDDEDEDDDEPDTPEGAGSERSGSDEARRRRRRRRKRTHTEPAFNPRVLQLAAFFLMLALVVWLLLRRMNQFPEGTVIDHGRLEALPTETTPRPLPASFGTTPAAFAPPPASRL